MESQVRRSARLSALRDGFKSSPAVIKPSPMKKQFVRPSKKRKTLSATPKPSPCLNQATDKDVAPSGVLPRTPIRDIQGNGGRLGIAPEKLAADKLMAHPASSSASKGSNDS